MSQQFCLKWNNHTTNMLQVFENLLTTEALVDVTLACDGLSLKAHKMVLSACSPFFQSLFLENPCKHPIVIMKDMRYCDLKAIIDFMYRGEVNVSHDQLSALLKTAETLKVKGLAEVTGENKQASGIVQHEIIQQNTSTPTPVPPSAQRTDTPPLQGKRKRGRPRKRSLSDSNRSDDEGVPQKIKETNSDIEELSGDASMEATSDNRSSGGPISCNSQSQVPIHSSNNVNTFSKSHLSTSQDPQGEEPASGDENEFEVEPSKLLEQTLTTENVPSNSHNSTGPITLPSVSGLEISRRSMSSTDSGSQALVPVSIPSDSLGSNVQGPDSPQDLPAIGHAQFPYNMSSAVCGVPTMLSKTELNMIYRRSHNSRQFAVNLARNLFSPKELRDSNCRGVRNYLPLDEQKLSFIRNTIKVFYLVNPNNELDVWKLCMQSIDSHCRHERRLYKKTFLGD